ncbi:MAG: DUF2330 domain-containing protein [Dehalococcoidia bacterium]
MKKKLIAAPLVAIVFLLSVTASPVLADGALFIGEEMRWLDLYQSNQQALILHDSGAINATQHLILSVSFEGEAEEFAWVIPVPGKPEISLSDAEVFRELSDFTIRAIPEPPKWGFGCGLADIGPPSDGVDVIDEKLVGPYATATLAATDPTALVDWLNANGYHFPDEGEPIIAEYIDKEWYFVATRINAVDAATGIALEEGLIEPIVLSFPSDEIVYPLRITSLSAKSPQVLLYILADQVVAPKQYPWRTGYGYWRENAFSLEFGDKVSIKDLSDYEVITGLISTYLSGDEFYLTKLRGRIRADQMVDIEFAAAPEYRLSQGLSSTGVFPGTNMTGGDIALLMVIALPVLGLHLWRRRRAGVSGASPRGSV